MVIPTANVAFLASEHLLELLSTVCSQFFLRCAVAHRKNRALLNVRVICDWIDRLKLRISEHNPRALSSLELVYKRRVAGACREKLLIHAIQLRIRLLVLLAEALVHIELS